MGALLAVEQLQHEHARNRFLQKRVDAGNRSPNAAIGIADLVAEDQGRVDNQRHNRKGHQRQLPVHLQHDDEDEGEDEHVLKNRDDARCEHFVQGIDVGGDSRDEPADGILVEEPDVHVLQMPENLAAQIEHDLLAGPLHEVGLDELQHKREHQQADIEAANLSDAGHRRATQAVTDPGVRVGRFG